MKNRTIIDHIEKSNSIFSGISKELSLEKLNIFYMNFDQEKYIFYGIDGNNNIVELDYIIDKKKLIILNSNVDQSKWLNEHAHLKRNYLLALKKFDIKNSF